MSEPVKIIAEPPLFEEWLEREIEDVLKARDETIARDLKTLTIFNNGYLLALRRVRKELEG